MAIVQREKMILCVLCVYLCVFMCVSIKHCVVTIHSSIQRSQPFLFAIPYFDPTLPSLPCTVDVCPRVSFSVSMCVLCVCVCVHVHVCVCVSVCISVYFSVCMSVSVCVSVCMCVPV